MEIGVERMLSKNEIGSIIENEVANDNSSACRDIITRQTGEINELTSQGHNGDNKKQAEKNAIWKTPQKRLVQLKTR